VSENVCTGTEQRHEWLISWNVFVALCSTMFYRDVSFLKTIPFTVFITAVVFVVLSGFQASTFTVGKRDALRVSWNSGKRKGKR
jgi:hypothetical protein